VLYLDTCIEPWAGGYTDLSMTPSQRSNYALRETALALMDDPTSPTAVIAHGANPGLVSHFVKQALLNLARDTGVATAIPADRFGWGALAQKLGVKVIHIAERDTQIADRAKQKGEFVNTWSIDGFVGEGCQPSELGWGTHEKTLPPDGHHHNFGCGAAIYLNRPGAATRVRTWTPMEGPFHGFLVTHNESISIADYFTHEGVNGEKYRPTVHYAYHPCDDAVLSLHELAGKNWEMQKSQRLMQDEIVSGVDELGVLLMGHAKGAYWYGSQLSIEDARTLAPHNNATSLQVTAAVLGGVIWAMENPCAGVREADEIDFGRVLDIALPYLGRMEGAYSSWTPLQDRGVLFVETVEEGDPWQFVNFQVV
jgi:homospermidine synthase